MAAPKKVTKEMIIQAGLAVLRDNGFEAINARSIAAKSGFSTQPIYKEFTSIEELKAAIHVAAIQLHNEKIAHYRKQGAQYAAYGLGFIRFAAEEKQLFRYLYLEGHVKVDPNQGRMLEILMKEHGWDLETCEQFQLDMTLYTNGLAIMAYVGTVQMSDEEIAQCLSREYQALSAIYQSKK